MYNKPRFSIPRPILEAGRYEKTEPRQGLDAFELKFLRISPELDPLEYVDERELRRLLVQAIFVEQTV